MPTLNDAVNTIRAGNREQGRQMLEEILETDEGNEDVWLWLSSVVDSDEDREICLENVLAINADNVVAQRGLEALRSGTFNVHGIIEEAIGEGKEQPAGESTFLDQFNLAGEEGESAAWVDELKTPDKKPAASPTKKPVKAAKPVNVRLILLIVLGLFVVLALASAAVYNIFLGGGQSQTPAPQQQPAQSTTSVAPTVEPTPTPAPPTDTPTPSFKLPTSKPTELPTPTGTPVVSPTVPIGK